MNTDTPAAETAQSSREQLVTASDIADIELPVHLELGPVTMRVEELSALKPGTILETLRDAKSPVSLRVNGKTIGTGELLEVAGRIAVRVTSIGNHTAEPPTE